MSSVSEFIQRWKAQVNPFDHGKTSANPTGLPQGVMLQTPGLDTVGPLMQRRVPLRTKTPNVAAPDLNNKAMPLRPIFGQDGLLKEFAPPLRQDVFGRPKDLPILIQPFEQRYPVDMGRGDYEHMTARDWMARPRSAPSVTLPIYQGRQAPTRIQI